VTDNRIRIIDTTLRDGQQSLWAARMPTDAMLPAARDIDAAGYDGIEFTNIHAQYTRMVRDLHEDPWQWIERGAGEFTKSSLRMHGGIDRRFNRAPRSVYELFLQRLAALGINTTRISDPWNDFEQLRPTMEFLDGVGFRAVVNIIFSVSPRHTPEYYAAKTREAVALAPYRLCLKDVGGLLTPETAQEYLPVILENAGGVPVELHAHCSNGLAPYVCLTAAELGVRWFHTAIPPLSDGSSLPSVLDLVPNLRARGYDVDFDEEPVKRAAAHFAAVAEAENLPVGSPARFSESLYRHQVPGGMISHLTFQLAQLGVEDRLGEVLDEVERVRADLGYPIMVTPLSQFVGSQAAMNVLSQSRYANVSDEIIQYALGNWGREAPTVMDQNVRDVILDRPRTDQQETAEVEELTIDQLRAKHPGVSDNELMNFYFTGRFLGEARTPAESIATSYAEYSAQQNSISSLLRSVSTSSRVRQFSLRTPEADITARRK
jgi:oxaloacetate decarboxylase (Na+ extruding) subunit alpha